LTKQTVHALGKHPVLIEDLIALVELEKDRKAEPFIGERIGQAAVIFRIGIANDSSGRGGDDAIVIEVGKLDIPRERCRDS
jgi:hypothetical protein